MSDMYPGELDRIWFLATGKMPMPWFSLSLKDWKSLKFHLKMHREWDACKA